MKCCNIKFEGNHHNYLIGQNQNDATIKLKKKKKRITKEPLPKLCLESTLSKKEQTSSHLALARASTKSLKNYKRNF